MNVLVTGAAGRLGQMTCETLVAAGHRVRGMDVRYHRDTSGVFASGSAADFRVADLRDYMAVYALVEGMDAVVHLGNYPNIASNRPPQVIYAENDAMNVNVFQAATEVGIRRIVFASSIQAMAGNAEFGKVPTQLAYLPIDGQSPQSAGNLYGLSKIAGENMLRYFTQRHPDLCGTALRFPFLVPAHGAGRGHKQQREVHKSARLDEGFAYLFFTDAAQLINAVLARQGPGYHCYLPAADTPSVALPIADLLREHYPNVPLRRPVETMTSLVDITAITRDLGWTPRERLPADV